MFDQPGKYNVLIVKIRGAIVLAAVLLFLFVSFYYAIHSSLSQKIATIETKYEVLQESHIQTNEKLRKLENQINVTNKDVEEQKKLLTFLAIVLNENFAGLDQDSPIFIGRGWKVQRMPKFLDMNENDAQWFKQFLIEQSTNTPQMPR